MSRDFTHPSESGAADTLELSVPDGTRSSTIVSHLTSVSRGASSESCKQEGLVVLDHGGMGFMLLRAAGQLPGRSAVLAVLLAGLLSGCGSDSRQTTPTEMPASAARSAALDRSLAIQGAVQRWADASTLADAKAAAEHARNLITVPRKQGAGDTNEGGPPGRVTVGLLPGEDGGPGLATPLAGACLKRDVLGGSWADPVARWAEVKRRIAQWAPNSNTFPALPSHAQRVVGWASLTLQTDRLADAHEFSGHAAGHASVVVAAIRSPEGNPCPGG